MASPAIKLPLLLFIFASFFLRAALGGIVCDDLPTDVCAFSISSSGKRCLLETDYENHGSVECKTSEVVVTNMADYIETDECVRACGVDRNSVGISSDALLEPQFTSKLCSPDCYQKCPNIIDLYFNLAAGEGAFLPDVCRQHRRNPRRIMLVQLFSSSSEADTTTTATPISTESSKAALGPAFAPAISPSPAPF
ncbi:uncharacterized protein LOC123215671 [Mangifera indica]|uniref:uncharacterized protein LOC123215671 n=1 Tax=Mangifera indica TaxID=29780 RepID=UPI001CFA4585|nr:uncharacterized protein LOC123215671 [Mangifera indica]